MIKEKTTEPQGETLIRQKDQEQECVQPEMMSVVVSARDEADALGGVITGVKESLSGYPYEIIVIDDGSNDDTALIAKGHGVITVSRDRNYGKGAAMKFGAQNASGNIIIFIDGDGAHDPKDLPRLVTPILENKADLVIGTRKFRTMSLHIEPWNRRAFNWMASFFISLLVSFALPLRSFFRYPMNWTRIKDCTSGLRAIKKESWQKLNIVSSGFEIETEMIYEAVRCGLMIVEIPVNSNGNNHGSHLSVLSDGYKSLKLLAKKLAGEMTWK